MDWCGRAWCCPPDRWVTRFDGADSSPITLTAVRIGFAAGSVGFEVAALLPMTDTAAPCQIYTTATIVMTESDTNVMAAIPGNGGSAMIDTTLAPDQILPRQAPNGYHGATAPDAGWLWGPYCYSEPLKVTISVSGQHKSTTFKPPPCTGSFGSAPGGIGPKPT